MKKRSNVPPKIADAVLVANNHTCCICTEPRKRVVFHHIDNPSNHDPANLAVVCHDCHSRVTGDEGLGRQYSPREVTRYKQHFLEFEPAPEQTVRRLFFVGAVCVADSGLPPGGFSPFSPSPTSPCS